MNDKITELSKIRANKARDEIKDRLLAEVGKMTSQQRKIDAGKLQSALQSLLNHAQGDHGGAKRCAMFLLSLWNGDIYKADLQDLMYNDPDIYDAMLYVLKGLYYTSTQLDSHLTDDQIKPIINLWGKIFRA
ncbi:MAG: hypothetical protein M0036_16370 [Desulfobacteraceae bacterium]|nr:hypothetical protein [Desulfobacteraceae bacterium]